MQHRARPLQGGVQQQAGVCHHREYHPAGLWEQAQPNNNSSSSSRAL